MIPKNTYVGRRYIPKHCGDWDNSKNTVYESLSVVLWQGASYTSKQDVPKGIDIGNILYWVKSADYNAQIAIYEQNVRDYHQFVLDQIGLINEDNTAFQNSVNETNAAFQNSVNETNAAFQNVVNNNIATKAYKVYVSLEELGVIGDGITPCDIELTNAINYCIEHNLILTSSKDKKYFISNNITIGSCKIKFNGSYIISNNKVVTLSDSDISDLHLRNTTVITTGSKLAINNIYFHGWVGTALELGSGTYSRSIFNIYTEQDSANDYTGNVGIKFNCTDTFVDGYFGHGMKTAIENNGDQNGITNAQPWIRGQSNFSGSIFLKNSHTNFVISNTIADTWESIFNNTANFLKVIVNNFSIINNTVMNPNATITIFNANCILIEGNILVRMTNFSTTNCFCYLGGFSKVRVEVIDGSFSDKQNIFKTDLQALMPAPTGNTTFTIGDNSYIKVNEGKCSLRIELNITGTVAATGLDILLPNIGLSNFTVSGKANAMCTNASGVTSSWVYYAIGSNKHLIITLPTNITGFWSVSIRDIVELGY